MSTLDIFTNTKLLVITRVMLVGVEVSFASMEKLPMFATARTPPSRVCSPGRNTSVVLAVKKWLAPLTYSERVWQVVMGQRVLGVGLT